MLTERVTSSRRAPFAVLLVVAAIVLVLAWKPWDKPAAVAPSPSALAARPTTSPTPSPSPSTQPTDTATPPATSTPTPASTLTPAPPPPLLGSVECEYEGGPGGTNVLVQLNIAPPYVPGSPEMAEHGVRRIAWRVELEINELESLFSADWQPVARSPRQYAPSLTDVPLHFSTLHMLFEHGPISPTSVVRVVVDLEAFGRRRAVIASQSIVALSYDVGAYGTLQEGCPAFLGTASRD